MKTLLLPIYVAAFMLLATAHPAFAQDNSRDGRERGRARSGEYERHEGDRQERRRRDRSLLEDIFRPRSLDVPKGHYPPPGECRMWHPGRPAGQQPPPVPCHRLEGRALGGGFILYGDRAYDTNRDWKEDERQRPQSIPEAILDIILSRRY